MLRAMFRRLKKSESKDPSADEVKENNAKTDISVPEEADDDTSKNGKTKQDDFFHIDEETFHAWQTAYEQAEENAMQEQAKASSECCNLTFQLVLLCLVVAKIEKNYENDDPNDTGFNMFWILFPFFIIFGCICCCCALLIYGAAPGSAEDLNDIVAGDEGKGYDAENPAPPESGDGGKEPESESRDDDGTKQEDTDTEKVTKEDEEPKTDDIKMDDLD
mmetsp:Transcript_15226/g.24675  ORF Transcript_15226/g.24675 Transcript_15226/m.24675 type:complete len:219 (-) Transcript_15226:52-708(-)